MTAKVILQLKNADDEYGFLYILYSDGAKRKKVSLKHKMLKKHFYKDKLFIKDLNNFNKTTLFDYKALNIKINNLINDTSIFDVKEDVVITSYLTYFQKYIDERLTKYTSKSAFVTSLKQFKIYITSIGRDDIQFSELTSTILDAYRTDLTSKGRTDATIKTYFTAMKCVFNNAIENKLYIDNNKIFNIVNKKIKVDNSKAKRLLKDDDVSKLKRISKLEYKHISTGKIIRDKSYNKLNTLEKEEYKEINNKSLFTASSMFLLSLFGNGMRFSDLLLLKLENIKRDTIEYKTLKNGKDLKISINYHLNRKICDILGLDNFHEKHKSSRMYNITEKLTYYELQDLITDRITKKVEYTDITLINYRGYNGVDKRDLELINLIDRLSIVSEEIDKEANISLYYAIKKKNSKDYLFKDFINSDIFNNFDTQFNDKQHKKYKTLMAKYDRQLTAICSKYDLSVEKLSSHNARHTFTNIILRMNNINLLDVSKLLGHSNLSTTQKYISKGFEFEKQRDLSDEFSRRFVNRN